MKNRVAVLHGINLDALDRRPAQHYGGLTFTQLEQRIGGFAHELGLEVVFFQSNFEGAFVEELHRSPDYADGLLLNPGAWTHYAWALRDAVEIAGLPAIEVHLSDVDAREAWRHVSVLEDVRAGKVSGKGLDGYREALGDVEGDLRVSRADRVAGRLKDVDALLVTEPANLRYVTGFTGSNGFAVVGPQMRRFVTDFRYVEQAKVEVPDFDREQGPQELLAARLRTVWTGSSGSGSTRATCRCARTSASVSCCRRTSSSSPRRASSRRSARSRSRGRSCASARPPRWSTRSTPGCSSSGWSARPSATSRSRSSTRCACAARRGRRSTRSSPRASTARCRTRRPRDVAIAPDTLVTLDIGAVLDGYCSDCTRTWATGDSVPDELVEIYALTLRAQVTSLDAVRPGPLGREIDAIARDIIDAAGHAEHFGHGLGHGVGLVTHEAPRLARSGSEPLVAGNVVTVEPGVYLPGVGGVRIEDLVVVTETGRDVLSKTTKELLTVE